MDYSEKRSLPITIPDYKHIQVLFTTAIPIPLSLCAELRSQAIFPRLRLQIFFFSAPALDKIYRFWTCSDLLRLQKTDFDTKQLKKLNFN